MISCCIPQEVRQTSEYGFDIDGRDGIIVINQSLSSKEHSGAVCVTRLIGFREDRTQCQLHSFYNSSVRNRDIIKEHYSELIMICTGEGIVGEQDREIVLLGSGLYFF